MSLCRLVWEACIVDFRCCPKVINIVRYFTSIRGSIETTYSCLATIKLMYVVVFSYHTYITRFENVCLSFGLYVTSLYKYVICTG